MTRKPSDRSSHIALEPKRGKRPVQVLLASLVVVALCVAIRCYWPAAPANADPIDSAPAGNWDADRSDSDQNSPPVERPNRQPPIRVARASTPATGLPGDRRNLRVPTIVATVNTKRIERERLGGRMPAPLRQGSAR